MHIGGAKQRIDDGDAIGTGVESRRPSLDDVFLGLTGRSLRDAETSTPVAEEVPA